MRGILEYYKSSNCISQDQQVPLEKVECSMGCVKLMYYSFPPNHFPPQPLHPNFANSVREIQYFMNHQEVDPVSLTVTLMRFP